MQRYSLALPVALLPLLTSASTPSRRSPPNHLQAVV